METYDINVQLDILKNTALHESRDEQKTLLACLASLVLECGEIHC